MSHERLSCSGQSVPERLNEQADARAAPELQSSHFEAGTESSALMFKKRAVLEREGIMILFCLLPYSLDYRA